jgi:hypothetical protein
MERLGLQDTVLSAVTKMSDGNPGAISAMTEIIKKHEQIDPQSALGGLGVIMLLDTYEIYGTDIYILYSDKCNRDVRRMLMIMRATQLGLFSHLKLKEMAHDQMRQVNLTEDEWKDLDSKVCEQLPEFAKP